MTVEGYALVFDAETVIWEHKGIEYKEVISRGALEKTSFRDCCLRYNHSSQVPILARTRGGSLALEINDTGLFFRANLFDTQASRDVFALVQGGALDKCSFAFLLADGGDNYDSRTRTRTIKNISRIVDCSIVDNPAYEQTSVSARDYFQAQQEAEERAEQEIKRRKLILRTYFKN